ncbi:hypothetical protein NV226_01385 [Mycoplasma iguanae]|uniref:Uncharacterized protein n=1 Tax=Mycoplasma iguanae TaxID=292461 RepID=A0ABY5R9E0_9MOLU|nr:hypothetical protein [Mycoplasma iguanae]UVD81941.1 hypothetical protein NV226_01385 [Mycoplasma iguanae]
MALGEKMFYKTFFINYDSAFASNVSNLFVLLFLAKRNKKITYPDGNVPILKKKDEQIKDIDFFMCKKFINFISYLVLELINFFSKFFIKNIYKKFGKTKTFLIKFYKSVERSSF